MRELGGAVERVASVPPVSADLPSTPHDDLDSPDASFDNFENQDFSRLSDDSWILYQTLKTFSTFLICLHSEDSTDARIQYLGKPRVVSKISAHFLSNAVLHA